MAWGQGHAAAAGLVAPIRCVMLPCVAVLAAAKHTANSCFSRATVLAAAAVDTLTQCR